MGIRVIESLGSAPGYIPVMIGNTLGQTQTVTNQEIVTELTTRGYRLPVSPAVALPVSPTVRTTTPTMTRPEAIKKAVDRILGLYRLPLRCTKLGGCALTEYRFNDIVRRSAALATSYLRLASVQTSTVSISPAPTYYTRLRGAGNLSPRLSGVGGTLYNMGQALPVFQPVVTQPPTIEPVVDQPGMTRWDWIAVIASAAQGVGSTLEAYANARAQRERAGQTATLTADQIKAAVNAAMLQNPTLNKSLLEAAAAGAGGREEPKGMPSWVVPAVIGIGVVVVMSSGFGRGRRR